METIYGRAGRATGWAPCFVLGAITVLWGIKGAPRCPTAAVQAAAALASWAGGAWGPAPAQR
eukprot:5630538-Lingulodinium_polyedra.AAC.1